jgi:hypothetical protein
MTQRDGTTASSGRGNEVPTGEAVRWVCSVYEKKCPKLFLELFVETPETVVPRF